MTAAPEPTSLRAFCSRILGWEPDRAAVVDDAMEALRIALTRELPLVLAVEYGGSSIAHALHRHVLGARASFVICDPYQNDKPASILAPANRRHPIEAFATQSVGTVCARHFTPNSAYELIALSREYKNKKQLIFCVRTYVERSLAFNHCRIIIPALSTRQQDMRRIIREYADDACRAFDMPLSSFTEEECQWVLNFAARSLHEIETAVLRLVTLRTSPNKKVAAERLGMNVKAMNMWRIRMGGAAIAAMKNLPETR